jgi:hypothetical protein
MLLVFMDAAITPAACASFWSLTYGRSVGNPIRWRRNLGRTFTVVAFLCILSSLYVQLGLPLNALYLTHEHESGAVREFLALVTGLYDSDYRQFAR